MDNLFTAWDWVYLLTFGGGLVMTLLTTPLCKRLAVKLDLMDRPAANHKGHAKATPLLGGLAMFLAWIICIGIGLAAAERIGLLQPHLAGLKSVFLPLLAIVGGALLAVALGLIDDKYALKAGTKFLGQFIVAAIAVTFGKIQIGLFLPHPLLVWCISVFWIMLLMNSINFFDNMDGLAVGTIAIAMGLFAVVAGLNQQYFIAVFAALCCGICCGFWVYNTTPASIFMGDSGSHFLGYLAAVTSAGVTFFSQGSSETRLPVLMPLFILALPLFDTAMVVIIRTLNKKPFWIGDHNHISHRFMKMGMSRKRAVMLVHLLALTIGIGVLPILWGTLATAGIIIAQTVLMLLVVTALQFFAEKKD